MKFIIAVEDLKDTLVALHGLASTPALMDSSSQSSFLFQIGEEKGKLTVVSSNGNQEQVRAVGVKKIDEPQSFVLKADAAVNIFTNLPDEEELSFSIDDDKCVINCSLADYTLYPSGTPDSYPTMNESDPEKSLKVSEANLKFIFDQTAFSAAKNDVRDYLNGVLLEVDKKRLLGVATNGHRLAKCELKNDTLGTDEKLKAVLPMKFVDEMRKSLEDSDNAVEVFFNETMLEARTARFSIATSLLDSRYPDWEKVIPQEFEWRLEMTKDDLSQSILRSTAVADEANEIVTLTYGKDKLNLSVKNQTTNDESVAKLDAKTEGKHFDVSFNSKYLSEAATTVDADTIVLEMKDPTTAAKMYGKGSNESIFIIMPIKR